jgi:hypothetical protein
MMVTPHNLSEPETIGLSVPFGGGNFSLIVGMSFDEAPMKAAATPAAPFAHVPICRVANHNFNAAGLRQSSLTRKPNATIKTPLAVNSMCAITIPRNHATAEGGMNPTIQPTVIWSTPRIRVQRFIFALKMSMSVFMGCRKGYHNSYEARDLRVSPPETKANFAQSPYVFAGGAFNARVNRLISSDFGREELDSDFPAESLVLSQDG